jgi:hypothetical protein
MPWFKVDEVCLRPGWYPVLLCYDPELEFLPSSAHFDGLIWSDGKVAKVLPKIHETAVDASRTAWRYKWEHDASLAPQPPESGSWH